MCNNFFYTEPPKNQPTPTQTQPTLKCAKKSQKRNPPKNPATATPTGATQPTFTLAR